MGYLSQKKHQIRENLLLNVTAVVLTFFTLFSLANSNFDIVFPNLFHLYLLSFAMIVYSAIVQKYKICLIFIMLFIINYTALSSSGNIFLSDNYNGNKKIELVFDKNVEITGNFNNMTTSSGSLILAGDHIAPYTKINDDTPLMIIKIDLNNTTGKLRKKILNQLKHFITKQDCPVIIFGDFGVPSWNRYLRKFVLQTRLGIKNRILYTDKSNYKFFKLPGFYILGFRNMGIDNIKIDNKNEQTIKFDVLF